MKWTLWTYQSVIIYAKGNGKVCWLVSKEQVRFKSIMLVVLCWKYKSKETAVDCLEDSVERKELYLAFLGIKKHLIMLMCRQL